MSRIVSTDKAPPALGPYSQAVKAGNLLYTAGQTGLRPDGEFVGGSVTDQAEQVMDNLEAVLAAAGCTFADVVKAPCYLTSMDDFKEFNAVYGSRFGDRESFVNGHDLPVAQDEIRRRVLRVRGGSRKQSRHKRHRKPAPRHARSYTTP